MAMKFRGISGMSRRHYLVSACSGIASTRTPTTFEVLTDKIVGCDRGTVRDIAMIEDPAAAEVSLDPVRARLLAELAEPASATMLAARVRLPRQKVNYHLRALERHRLVELVEERRKGNCTERVLRATARSYVISPAALGSVQPDPGRSGDRLSAQWLLALGARLVRDVGGLLAREGRSTGGPERIATFALDTEVRFASARDRAEFTAKLANAFAALVAEYHDETADDGRPHHVLIALHPSLPTNPAVPANPADVNQENQR
jgi:DNA-binding transcriptional ArsR family regulator